MDEARPNFDATQVESSRPHHPRGGPVGRLVRRILDVVIATLH